MVDEDKQRLDRELMELLNELRVALPGVQVLFAFLLTVPFTQRFPTVTSTQKHAYFASILCTAAASALLMAPTAYHRISFRGGDKERLVVTSTRLTIAGMAFLAAAIVLVIWVVTDVLFDGAVVGIATAGVGLGFVLLWYALPLKRRADNSD